MNDSLIKSLLLNHADNVMVESIVVEVGEEEEEEEEEA